jgi:hypothetical protein
VIATSTRAEVIIAGTADRLSAGTRKERVMILWLLLSFVYIALCITLGLMTFRARHYVLFAAGFILPLLWLVGAMISPRQT